MRPIETRAVIALQDEQKLRGVVARLRPWFAGFIAQVFARDNAPADPTANFTTREWADLPTHHPASDE
jgi:hypothetical protein